MLFDDLPIGSITYEKGVLRIICDVPGTLETVTDPLLKVIDMDEKGRVVECAMVFELDTNQTPDEYELEITNYPRLRVGLMVDVVTDWDDSL